MRTRGTLFRGGFDLRSRARIAQRDLHDDPKLTLTLNPLAAMYDELGRYAEAERTYLRALKIVGGTIGADSAQHALISSNLAVHYVNDRQTARARELLQDVTVVYDRLL